MPSRNRLLAWLGGVTLVVGAVVTLRVTDDPVRPAPEPEQITQPVRINRYAAENVVLPQPGEPPPPPTGLQVRPASGQLRLSWSDGGDRTAGYDVRWQRPGQPPSTRRVSAPDVQLDGLIDGETYQIEVRGVDGFGQRSAGTAVTATPGPAAEPWRADLTGLYDDFSDPRTVRAEQAGSRWHLSGYRGCVDLGDRSDRPGLAIDLGCGADLAVLRARQPMSLAEPPGPDGVLGRVEVSTDAAGPGGELTIDLVPGPADRVGGDRRSSPGPVDPTLPAGAIRAVLNDRGAQVLAGPGTPAVAPVSNPAPAPRRGPGVRHRFELTLTTSGVQVRQDDTLVAAGGPVPTWRQAWVLLGVRGPDGRRARIHVSGAGFSGPPSPVPDVVEAPANPATRRVLGLTDEAPGAGIARAPLVGAAAARLVMTISTGRGLDPTGVVIQFGDRTIPSRPATPGPFRPGSEVTLLADLPADLLGATGPDPLSPFVVRAPDRPAEVEVLESYLEITPGPGWTAPAQTRTRHTDAGGPVPDALPAVNLVLGNASGAPLPGNTVPARGVLVLTVRLDAAVTQWDTGGVAGVQGFEVWLDGRVMAALPTAAHGPGVGGVYPISLGLGGLAPGGHVLEVRQFGPDRRPESFLQKFVVS